MALLIRPEAPTRTKARREPRPDASNATRTARVRALHDVLLDGLVNPVSLAHVHWFVAQQHPTAGDRELQHETVATMRYLVRAGLADVGYPAAGGRFVTEPLDLAMQEVHDAYIAHYDEPDHWIWCCWLNLTPAGRQLARSTRSRVPQGMASGSGRSLSSNRVRVAGRAGRAHQG
jgi:hypothetical protein